MKTHRIIFSFVIGMQLSPLFLHGMEQPNKNQNYLDPRVQALFLKAVAEGTLPLIQACVEKGANVNSLDITGTSPLALAINSGNIEVIGALIGHGALVDAHDVKKEKILELFKTHPLLCDVLYNSEALINDTREHSDALLLTAFTIAVSQGRSDAFQNLLECYEVPDDGLVKFTKLVFRIRKTATLTRMQQARYQIIKDILMDQIHQRYPLLNRQPMP